MGRLFAGFAARIVAMTFVIVATANLSLAQNHDENHNGGQSWSGYQRRAYDQRGRHGHHGRRDYDRNRWNSPQVSSGWFQRPYPYHLDYYKMRYNGSYEPYFGNLYGPPQVVTAPPYYGGYGPGFGGAYGAEAFGGGPGGYPVLPQTEIPVSVFEDPNDAKVQPPSVNGETLPVPVSK